jgi:hypothetical protein
LNGTVPLLLQAVGFLAVLAILLPGGSAPRAGAGGAAVGQTAHLETGDFSEFGSPDVADGQLLSTTTRSYDGRRSARATYCGGGDNGYARGVFGVNFGPGHELWYGAAFYLPRGFKRSVQGEVDILRWDNFGRYGGGGDFGGVAIFDSDKQGHLTRGRYAGAGDDLAGAFSLPEGRWFWLEVHQYLANNQTAFNEVFVDGHRAAASSAPNSFGRAVGRVRYGIVAMAAGRQKLPLRLWFDRAWAGRRRAGPLPGARRGAVAGAMRRNGSRSAVIGRGCRVTY